MATITIHNLSKNLEKELRQKAKAEKKSINQTVKDLLEAALSPSYSALKKEQNRAHFKEFFGTWTEEEARAFDKAVDSFNQIDENDWK